MSIYCMSYVWQTSQEHGTSLLMLLALADYANDSGKCWPGVKALAQKCRISERNARFLIRQLEDDGVIRTDIHAGTFGNGGRTNRYTIVGFAEWMREVKKIKSKVGKNSVKGGALDFPRSVITHAPQDSPSTSLDLIDDIPF